MFKRHKRSWLHLMHKDVPVYNNADMDAEIRHARTLARNGLTRRLSPLDALMHIMIGARKSGDLMIEWKDVAQRAWMRGYMDRLQFPPPVWDRVSRIP